MRSCRRTLRGRSVVGGSVHPPAVDREVLVGTYRYIGAQNGAEPERYSILSKPCSRQEQESKCIPLPCDNCGTANRGQPLALTRATWG